MMTHSTFCVNSNSETAARGMTLKPCYLVFEILSFICVGGLLGWAEPLTQACPNGLNFVKRFCPWIGFGLGNQPEFNSGQP